VFTALVILGASVLRIILKSPRRVAGPGDPAVRTTQSTEPVQSGNSDAPGRDRTDSHRTAIRWRWYRTFTVALLTIAFGLFGLLLYRSSPPTVSYPSLTLDTFVWGGRDGGLLPIWEISIREYTEAESTFVYIGVTVQQDEGTPDAPLGGYIEVILPAAQSGEIDCPVPCSVIGVDGPGLRVLKDVSPGDWINDHGDLWFQTLSFRVNRLLPGLQQNGVHASVSTPAVTTAEVVPYETDVVYTHSIVSPESYDWVDGPRPTYASDAEGRATWTLAMESSRLEFRSSKGVNLEQDARERNEVFLSGISLGIAGSTLVALFLEVLAGPLRGLRSLSLC
jgi:hypothetical protein